MAPRLDACVDAYFLDGFAPGRNPRMGTGAARTGRHGSARRDPGHLGLHRRAASGIVESGFDARRETGYGGNGMTVATARGGRAGAQARARIRPQPRRRGGRRPGWRRHRSGVGATRLARDRAGRRSCRGVAAHADHVAAALTPWWRVTTMRAPGCRAQRAALARRWREAQRRASAARCSEREGGGAGGTWKRWRFPPSGCNRSIAMKPARWPACRWRAARISRRAC